MVEQGFDDLISLTFWLFFKINLQFWQKPVNSPTWRELNILESFSLVHLGYYFWPNKETRNNETLSGIWPKQNKIIEKY